MLSLKKESVLEKFQFLCNVADLNRAHKEVGDESEGLSFFVFRHHPFQFTVCTEVAV